MLKVVLDTNIVISAALSPTGNCAKIFDIITADNDQIQLFCNEVILLEYQNVLSRKHLNIKVRKQEIFLETIKNVGQEIVPTPSNVPLPDESDRIFFDTALASGAILITGNKKHYPPEYFVLLPAEFLRLFEQPSME